MDLFATPNLEALKLLKRRRAHLTFNYDELIKRAHHQAFTVAKITKLDLLLDIQNSIKNALLNGQGFDAWKSELVPTLKRKGWWGFVTDTNPKTGEQKEFFVGSRRLKTIYYTNIRTAFAVSNYQELLINFSDEQSSSCDQRRAFGNPLHKRLSPFVSAQIRFREFVSQMSSNTKMHIAKNSKQLSKHHRQTKFKGYTKLRKQFCAELLGVPKSERGVKGDLSPLSQRVALPLCEVNKAGNCRCTAIGVSDDTLERQGLKVTERLPNDLPQPHKDWDYHVGQTSRLKEILRRKEKEQRSLREEIIIKGAFGAKAQRIALLKTQENAQIELTNTDIFDRLKELRSVPNARGLLSVVLSGDTYKTHSIKHPEISPAHYARIDELLDNITDLVISGENKVVFFLQQGEKSYVFVLKVTKNKTAWLTTFYKVKNATKERKRLLKKSYNK